MNLVLSSYATPTTAFLEGLVRIFDWWSLVLALRHRRKGIPVEDELEGHDSSRNRQVIDRYVRDSITAFELQETSKLSGVPFIPRRVSVVADTQLGTMPTDDVIIHYEGIVPGAVDRIMGLASDRLKVDSEAEIKLFRNLCRQGYRGMLAGFVLTLLLGGGALFLMFADVLWAGMLLVGTNFALAGIATAYVSLGGLRGKWFTGEFFPRIFYTGYRYRLNGTDSYRRPSL